MGVGSMDTEKKRAP
jgi:hypothetical protein